MAEPGILVFASGTKTGGGSGVKFLIGHSRTNPPGLETKIKLIVSNHPEGGVARIAKSLGTPFHYWPGPFTAEGYQKIFKDSKADFAMLSGWLKLVQGLETPKTINIHPGPLPMFGGPKMYGHRVHEAVFEAYQKGRITQSAVTMHFVDEVYDRGPIFLRRLVPIFPGDNPETLAKNVNEIEHAWQFYALNLVIHQHIECLPDDKGWWRVHYKNTYLKKILMDRAGTNGLVDED